MKQLITSTILSIVALALLPDHLQAQTFTNLHTFGPATVSSAGLYTNLDGAYLYSRLVASGTTLYGVTGGDNSNGLGGVFRINTDGTSFTNLFAFSLIKGGDNGGNPEGALLLSGKTLYGTTKNGGTNYTGTVFAINTDGTGFGVLHQFSAMISNNNTDGAYPEAGMVLSGAMIYGTTYSGGTNGDGVVFGINTNGNSFTNLFNFAGTNGQNPQGVLVAAGGMLYGTTYSGGIDTNGTIFAINTNGTGFSNYHSFTQVGYPYPTNSDGAYPEAGMVLSGSTLYGTTMSGGTNGFGYGTIFSINTNGMDFKPVLDFNYTQGYGPLSDLIVANNVLYGTTTGGGTYLAGTIFSVNTNGTDLTDLYSFPLANYSGTAYTNSTGTDPWAGVVFSGNGLFGVTPVGGTGGVGTVYGLILGSSAPVPIPLNTQLTNGTLTLTWSDATFSLQSTTDLGLAFTNVPGAVSPYSVSTNSPEQFFRLQAN